MSQSSGRMAAMKSAPAPAEKKPTLLARVLAADPRGEYVVMPKLGRVWVQLAGEMIEDRIESETLEAMKALGIPQTPLNSMTYDSRRTALTLAWAVRDADSPDHGAPVGTVQEWLDVDVGLLSACGHVYGDVRERLNPMGSDTLTEDEFEQIRLAHEKKNPAMLRTFGVILLSSYLATTAAPPASSPTPPSSAGPS